MKITVERTQFEPVYDKNGLAVSWNIAWNIETDTGLQLYAPASVSRTELQKTPTEANVTVHSFTQVLPGQIYHLYKDVDVLTELDKIAMQIAEVDNDILSQSEHNKLLQEARTVRLQEAQARLKAKQEEHRKLVEAAHDSSKNIG